MKCLSETTSSDGLNVYEMPIIDAIEIMQLIELCTRKCSSPVVCLLSATAAALHN